MVVTRLTVMSDHGPQPLQITGMQVSVEAMDGTHRWCKVLTVRLGWRWLTLPAAATAL
jgi:hypothetical protein